jgi:amidase
MDYKSVSLEAQTKLLNCIPVKWRLASIDKSITDVTSIPTTCGLLTPSQLAITEMTATQLLSKLHTGALTSVEVTEAFCGRAAIAHQLVNCLTMYFYEEALQTARKLDREFKKTGKPVGPLHGLPVSIKVSSPIERRRDWC